MFTVKSHVETKREMRIDTVRRTSRLFTNPAVMDCGTMRSNAIVKDVMDLPQKLMKIRKMAQVALEAVESYSAREARYFARVEMAMARSAPMRFKTVSSSC